MIEFALFLPVLVALAMGVLEFGLAWHDSGRVERSVQTAGRAASTVGPFQSAMADFDAVRAVATTLAGADHATLERVIVYNSTAPDGAPPQACLNVDISTPLIGHGVSGVCNVYSAAQVAQSDPSVGFSRGSILAPDCDSGDWDDDWCPVDRVRDIDNPVYVGVYVEANFDWITGLLPGNGVDISRYAVFQLEPNVQGA